jgi:ankyrin repeat protein
MKLLLRHFPPRRGVTVLLLGAAFTSLAACHKTDADVTDILRAANSGDLARTRLLLTRDPNVALGKNCGGFTALHYAAFNGYLEIAKLLVAKNANISAKTEKSDTPLHYAASYGHKDIVELLLSNKAKVDVRDANGCTPVYDAAASGQIEEVRILLAAKADVNAATLRGYTPLSGAASHGREDVVRLLIDDGANVNAVDFDGGHCTGRG